jgi:hypothetical protein
VEPRIPRGITAVPEKRRLPDCRSRGTTPTVGLANGPPLWKRVEFAWFGDEVSGRSWIPRRRLK